jgi:uncharacterized protein (TIGR02271 family)
MQTVIGIFDDNTMASQAVTALKGAGFADSRVQVQSGSSATTGTTSTAAGGAPAQDDGMLAEVGHFFSKLFGDDAKEQTSTYSEAVRRGGYVVTVDVHDDEEADTVSTMLDDAGAYDIDERTSQWKADGWQSGTTSTLAQGAIPSTAFASTAPATTATSSTLSADDQAVLPVIEEELKVGKRTVQRGGVRVVQRVTETPVNESVSLTEEHASIERRPVDRVATAADLNGMRDVSIEVRETAEEAVVSKEARVVEEVVVGKVASEHVQSVSDSVKRTDVDVERFEPTTGTRSASMLTDAETGVAGVPLTGESDLTSSDWKAGKGPQGGL